MTTFSGVLVPHLTPCSSPQCACKANVYEGIAEQVGVSSGLGTIEFRILSPQTPSPATPQTPRHFSPQPQLPDRLQRNRLVDAYQRQGMRGLSAEIRSVYGVPDMPQMHVRAQMREYLETFVGAPAASDPQNGEIFLPYDEQTTDAYLKWHEVGHCIQAALGAEVSEAWADEFASVMKGEKMPRHSYMGDEAAGRF